MRNPLLCILAAMAALLLTAPAVQGRRTLEDPGPLTDGFYRGYNWRIDENGDSMLVLYFKELPVYPPQRFKNKKEEEYYWRTVRNVKLTLPYAKLISETLIETYEYLETFPNDKAREKYLKEMEGAIFQQYKPVLKRFSRTQAKILIKLVMRETNQSSYEIVKAFLGSFRATFWQGFGRLFGVSLKAQFNPQKDKDDATINRIASLVERGML